MKVSIEWLRDFVNIENIRIIPNLLTNCGLEVETIEEMFDNEDLIVGEIVECVQHPNADRLHCLLVDIGTSEKLHIVCGAPNVRVGLKSILAPVGTTLKMYDGEVVKIKKVRIRGEESQGMFCAEDEVGISANHEKIIELDKNAQNGQSIKSYLLQHVVDIELTPNRGDACSHLGVARDIRAVLHPNIPLRQPQVYQLESTSNDNVIQTEYCKCYRSVVINNVHIKESPLWLKCRLIAVGVRPINNVVDITNYVMMELGQPMHAYDMDKINGNIYVRLAQPQESMIALDGNTYKDCGMVVADDEKILGIAGIIGGKPSAITNDTTTIMFEAAYFEPTMVRQTSKKLKIRTEASYRFERGVDPNFSIKALQRACYLLKCQQNDIVIGKASFSGSEQKMTLIKFDYSCIERILGIQIPVERVDKILNALEIRKKDECTLEVPPYRVDVTRDCDVVEEIIRIYGYNNIVHDNKISSLVFNQFKDVSRKYNLTKQITDIFVPRGWCEIYTNSIVKNNTEYNDIVHIINPLSSDLNVMRFDMYSSLESVVEYNTNRGQKDLLIFEIGKTYKVYDETTHCACLMTGCKPNGDKYTFFDLKDEIYLLFNMIGVRDITESVLSDGVSIYQNQTLIGTIRDMGNSFYADILLDKIYFNNHKEYGQISKFPMVQRDLSFVIDDSVKYSDLEKIIKNLRNELIVDFRLKDVYQGEAISDGKKSYTLTFSLQSYDDTLNNTQIQYIMNSVTEAVTSSLNAIVRVDNKQKL